MSTTIQHLSIGLIGLIKTKRKIEKRRKENKIEYTLSKANPPVSFQVLVSCRFSLTLCVQNPNGFSIDVYSWRTERLTVISSVALSQFTLNTSNKKKKILQTETDRQTQVVIKHVRPEARSCGNSGRAWSWPSWIYHPLQCNNVSGGGVDLLHVFSLTNLHPKYRPPNKKKGNCDSTFTTCPQLVKVNNNVFLHCLYLYCWYFKTTEHVPIVDCAPVTAGLTCICVQVTCATYTRPMWFFIQPWSRSRFCFDSYRDIPQILKNRKIMSGDLYKSTRLLLFSRPADTKWFFFDSSQLLIISTGQRIAPKVIKTVSNHAIALFLWKKIRLNAE